MNNMSDTNLKKKPQNVTHLESTNPQKQVGNFIIDKSKSIMIGLIPGIIIATINILPIKSFNVLIILLAGSIVLILIFYMWLIYMKGIYFKWAISVGIIATLICGVIIGYNYSTYHFVDIKYNLKLPSLCDEKYPNFQNAIINEDELKEFSTISNCWLFSHVYAGRGNLKYPSAKKAGVDCESKDFVSWNGMKDHGERILIEEKIKRTAIKLKWDLQEDTWCSFSIETSVLQGIPYQRTFDLDRYKRLSFDVFIPSKVFAKQFYIRLEDDASIRNPNIHIPFSTNAVDLLKYLPSPDPNHWSTTPISLPLSVFNFKPDSWIDDYDPAGINTGIINFNESFPDKHHIAQVTFVIVGESLNEIYLTNIRFE
jgi:hypothetical protein